MLCPKCGEDNPPAFRFCGMCGTHLVAEAPKAQPAAEIPQATNGGPSPHQRRVGERRSEERVVPVILEAPEPVKQKKMVSAISGPSLLGLDQASTPGPADDWDGPSSPPPSSYIEPDEPIPERNRILVLLALLLALGAAAWWTYSNHRKTPGTATLKPNVPATATETASPATTAANSQAQSSAPAAQPTPTAPSPASQPREKSASAPPARNQATDAEMPAPKPATSVTAARKQNRSAEAPSSAAVAVKPAADDNDDADYHKGEAYLYGRGVPESCEQALKFLKAASAKQNARARGTFGTMYATGHCVPRDLPTAYGWFALALHADPSSQILEKDLTAIWNQMTPPERELATKMKP